MLPFCSFAPGNEPWRFGVEDRKSRNIDRTLHRANLLEPGSVAQIRFTIEVSFTRRRTFISGVVDFPKSSLYWIVPASFLKPFSFRQISGLVKEQNLLRQKLVR